MAGTLDPHGKSRSVSFSEILVGPVGRVIERYNGELWSTGHGLQGIRGLEEEVLLDL